jgi:Ni/Fe-hydrogenase 1 B-type cytochrome subunit
MSQSGVTGGNQVAMQRVYVWEFPVRLFHWVNAACILVLIITGYLIGRPLNLTSHTEASYGYWFGTARFIHFATAYVFFFNFLFRIYWGFVGNQYANWRSFFPFQREQRKEILDVLKVDILLSEGKGGDTVGHNSLAGLTYFIMFLVFLFQCATGFGMYAAMSDAWLPQMFAWVIPLMGGDFAARQWHNLMMWFFIIFSVIHIYLVFYHDYVEGRGVLSSMAGGWKFIPIIRRREPGQRSAPAESTSSPRSASGADAKSRPSPAADSEGQA